MITKKYYKMIRVSYADSDYFRVTNVDNTAGTLTINGSNNLGKNLEYSTDGVNWTTADPNAPFSLTVPAGANVYMRGTNSSWYATALQTVLHFDVSYKIGGNILSIIDKNNYASITSLSYSSFNSFFCRETHLVDASDLNFGNMTTCGSECFKYMFYQCTGLVKAPETLPATTLGTGCYSDMFSGCTSLVVAPILPAENLPQYSYFNMFSNCSSLNTITCLATTIGLVATGNWLNNVSATGTFYKSANMSGWTTGASGIPSGWTVVDY